MRIAKRLQDAGGTSIHPVLAEFGFPTPTVFERVSLKSGVLFRGESAKVGHNNASFESADFRALGDAPPLSAAHLIACSRLQGRHPFAEQPKGFVELDILIDPINGAGLYTTGPSEIVTADAAQSALNGVLLNHIPDGP